jgi:gluconate 2-dehydrogenase gamma chain
MTFEPSRRKFLGTSSVFLMGWAANTTGIGAALAHARRAAFSRTPVGFQFFTPEEAADLDAITTLIWPADDTPGASELGITHFVDHVFASGTDASFADVGFSIYDSPIGVGPTDGSYAPLVRDGLSQLGTPAGRFATLPTEQQRQALTAIETTPFFLLLRRMTLVGLLAEPAYGGNAAKGGWKAIGFEDRFYWQPPFGSYDR